MLIDIRRSASISPEASRSGSATGRYAQSVDHSHHHSGHRSSGSQRGIDRLLRSAATSQTFGQRWVLLVVFVVVVTLFLFPRSSVQIG